MKPSDPVSLFRSMLRIRRVEEALAVRYAEQEMRCPMHLCIGQEAIAAGVCAALEPSDPVFSNHRAHGHYLAKGGNLNRMVAELYGCSTGCGGGRGGSMHLIDPSVGFMGSTPIVGGTVPLAVGAAWATKLQAERQVTVAFFGDGCFEEGVVHESMNFAALHRLPVIFVCEDNDFSVYTRRDVRQPNRPIHEVAAAHGVQAAAGNGNDVDAVFGLATEAVDRARSGVGPQFLELRAYRWREHCGPNFDDELGYRSEHEIKKGLSECPLDFYKPRLASTPGQQKSLIDSLEKDIAEEIDAALRFAQESAPPDTGAGLGKLYVNAIKLSVTSRQTRGETTNHANPREWIRADSRDS